MTPSTHDIVLLSTADWDNPFWTNKQHVAKELEKKGFRILYIESVGIRKPSVKSQDVLRIIRRIIKGVRPPKKVSSNIYVWSPLSIPFRRYTLVNWLNKQLFNCLLSIYKRTVLSKKKKKVLWTYLPITKQYIQPKKFDLSVYHCVDDISAQPRMPVDLINVQEKLLTQEVDYVFTTAPSLQEKCSVWNDNTFFFPNVADYDHFSSALSEECHIPDDIKAIPNPKVGFIGAISSYKLNFELIAYTAQELPDTSFVFIGKVGEGDPLTSIDTLQSLKNVHFVGPREYKLLPNYLKDMDAMLLPNNINQYTTSMFPMKFFEYLAAGKPIVSVDLPAIKEHSKYYYVSEDYSSFVKNVQKAIFEKRENEQNNSDYAKQFTYTNRMEKMLEVINRKTV
ncbi:MAG: glycosyltransferase [Cyclobacteriaceae bacterium]